MSETLFRLKASGMYKAQEFVEKDAGRIAARLSHACIHITKKGQVIATDGRILFYSENQLIGFEEGKELDRDYAIKLNGKISKSIEELTIEKREIFCFDRSDNLKGIVPIELQDHRCPNWENVIPISAPELDGGTIGLKPEYIQLMNKTFGGRGKFVKMEFHGTRGPIIVRPFGGNEDNEFALLMPAINT